MLRPIKINIPEPPAPLLWIVKVAACAMLLCAVIYFTNGVANPNPLNRSDAELRALRCKHWADLYGDCIEISSGVWGFRNEMKQRPN